jgi:hypothetical protein
MPNTEDEDYFELFCHHDQLRGQCEYCAREEDEMYERGIEKCLNCGKIKFADQLDANQICIKPCVNPNEY